MIDRKRIIQALVRAYRRVAVWLGFRPPQGAGTESREASHRRRDKRFYTLSVTVHLTILLLSLLSWSGCLHRVPKGIPGGKGEKLPMGKVVVIRTPKRIQRKRRVRQSPVSVYEMLKEQDNEDAAHTAQMFSDSVGVPGGIGEGAAAAGSPHGTVLGGKLYFYRVKFSGPDWDSNSTGVRPLMNEVLHAGVVKKVSGFNNVVALDDLPKHTGEYLPNMLYMTGTGTIKASDKEVANLRDYLKAGGMLFADNSGGDFNQAFIQFMKRVFPDKPLEPIEYDNEIYRGRAMPYAMLHGCPIYRRHRGSGPALGLWLGPRIAVFYSTGDLGSAWGSAGLFKARRRSVEQAFRMGVNLVAYSLLYYKNEDS